MHTQLFSTHIHGVAFAYRHGASSLCRSLQWTRFSTAYERSSVSIAAYRDCSSATASATVDSTVGTSTATVG
jgi:hypothetical protein